MREERFHMVMEAVEEEFLEEAKQPLPKRRARYSVMAAMAAGIGLLIISSFLLFSLWEKPNTVTAEELLELGYSISIPDGAQYITYALLTHPEYEAKMAEVTFRISETHYVCRIVATPSVDIDFSDISDTELSYEKQFAAELQWCPARGCYNEGAAGKLVWFDVVPGLLYSMTMDRGASEETLLEMGLAVFSPAQE